MGKKELRKMFPDWATTEAIIERISREYGGDVMPSDIYRNDNGDVVLTMDCEHISIYPDYDRPGLYAVTRARIGSETTYSDANRGLYKFQED